MKRQLESDELHERVRRFIAHSAGALGEDARGERFDELALALARYQAEHVEPFARLVRARGVDLRALRSVDAIPALVTDVFRHARVAAHPPDEDRCVFKTSGTTEPLRGEHSLRRTGTYELAAIAWGRAMLWPDAPPQRCIALTPPGDVAPESSLSFMVDLFAEALDAPIDHCVGDHGLEIDVVHESLADARDSDEPTLVMGTAFAFVELFDRIGDDFALPPGSRCFFTGGFKGRTREVDAEQLRALVARRLGVPPRYVIGEYGMTELSSQLYEATIARGGAPGRYVAPPWLRVRAADPETLALLPDGVEGLARFVDLANVDSVIAVQTADHVRVHPDGVELLGRDPNAVPRGCALAREERLGA